MVRDKVLYVKYLAAKLTVYLERTNAIPDLKAAVENEINPDNKAKMQEQLDLLESIRFSAKAI